VFSLSLPRASDLDRSGLIGWSIFHDTVSRGSFAKESLRFHIFKPAVHGVFTKYVFLFRKHRFVYVDSKYVFEI
jgi:hypothetical protein